MKALLYFQKLSDLGKFRIEKTDDYDLARRDGLDLSYYEMIRVRGSKPERNFKIPSNVSKYSNNELLLYLKDHKRYWPQISKILDQQIDKDSEEAVFIFPYKEFYKIDKILHLFPVPCILRYFTTLIPSCGISLKCLLAFSISRRIPYDFSMSCAGISILPWAW